MRVLPGVILSIGLYPGEVPPQQGNGYEVYTMAKAGNSVLSRSTQSYTQQPGIKISKNWQLVSMEEGFTNSLTSQSVT